MPQVKEGQSVVLEPKYCEGCGTLGFRPRGEDVTSCARCHRRLEQQAVERGRASLVRRQP